MTNYKVAVESGAEPLLRRSGGGTGGGTGGDSPLAEPKESLWAIYLSTAIAVSGSFEFGTCVGFSAPTQSGIRTEIGLSLSEYAFFGSIFTIGAMIGAVTSGRIADSLGRKEAMRISAAFCMIGWLSILLAQNALMLYFGRIISGYGIGVLSYVVPVFIAEIAPKNIRGGLTTLNQLMICVGGSAAYILGAFITWRKLVLLGLAPCLVLIFGLFWVPESPRWLAKVGRHIEFYISLQKLHGKEADISQEASEILEYIEAVQKLPKARVLDLFQKRYIRSVVVGVGLMVFQQIGGINGIGFYATETFVAAGFSSGNLGTILWGVVQLPITVVGAFLMDRSGRRVLLIVSASGTFLGTFMAGVSFFLKGQGIFLQWVPMLALIGILVYISAFSIGMGAVPWIIMSEIFPINIKATGGSLVTLVSWFGSWLVSYTFNFLMDWSAAGTFFIYAAASAITVLFVAMIVPETKGKTLEEIQESMNSKK